MLSGEKWNSERFSHLVMSDSLATPWTIAHQAPLSMKYWSVFAIPFSRRSSQPRDRTLVFCIAGRPFTAWTTGKPIRYPSHRPGGGGVLCPPWAGQGASNAEASCLIAGGPVADRPLGEQGSKHRPAWVSSLKAYFSELLALVAVLISLRCISCYSAEKGISCVYAYIPPWASPFPPLWAITKPRAELPCVTAGPRQLPAFTW